MYLVSLGRIFLFLGTLFALFGCGGGAGAPEGGPCSTADTQVVRLSVSPDRMTIAVNEPFRFAVQAFNACNYEVSGVPVTWSVTDPTVARFDAQNYWVGQGSGTVVVTAAAQGGTSASATLTVLATVPAKPPIARVIVYPQDAKLAVNFTRQMTAVAYADGSAQNPIPNVNFSWDVSQPNLVAVLDGAQMKALATGKTTVQARPTQQAATFGSTSLTILSENGAPPPPPVVTVSPTTVTLGVGDAREVRVAVFDGLTGTRLVDGFTVLWSAAPPGIIQVAPQPTTGEVATITGVKVGKTELTAAVTVGTETSVSSPVDITVLASVPGVGPWKRAEDLPYTKGVYGHGVSVVRGHLITTGGVGGDLSQGGPREDVVRGAISLQNGVTGWVKSPNSSSDDPAQQLFGECVGDPACMYIFRSVADGSLEPPPGGFVHYQVFAHGQAATADHIYVAGGIDAQKDLCITQTNTTGTGDCQTNPPPTRYSDRFLYAAVLADGSLIGWSEGPRLPPVNFGTGDVDTPGRAYPALVHYQGAGGEWLYLIGGWGWVDRSGNQVGRNSREIMRIRIDPDTGVPLENPGWEWVDVLPQALNKHAAGVVGNWLVVIGGATGGDENSPEGVSGDVLTAPLNPSTGAIGGWQLSGQLPAPLENHQLVTFPGDNRLVVVGGDDLYGSSSVAVMTTLDTSTGLIKRDTSGNSEWQALPELAYFEDGTNVSLSGVTLHAAAGVRDVDDAGGTPMPVFRIYVTGGGQLLAQDTPTPGADFELVPRYSDALYLDLEPLP